MIALSPSIRKRRVARRGFTLIELLVVVVIIGILASVAMPSFANAQDRARNSAAVSNLNVVRQALEMYSADNSGIYPANADFATSAGLAQANYLPGNKLPKSPWSKESQTTRIGGVNWPLMCAEWINNPAITYPDPGTGFSTPLAGAVADVPTLPIHYGALTSDCEDSNSGGDRSIYVVNVTGKKGKYVINAGWITNAGR